MSERAKKKKSHWIWKSLTVFVQVGFFLSQKSGARIIPESYTLLLGCLWKQYYCEKGQYFGFISYYMQFYSVGVVFVFFVVVFCWFFLLFFFCVCFFFFFSFFFFLTKRYCLFLFLHDNIYSIVLDKRGYEVNIFLISPWKQMLWVLIRSASYSCFTH